MAALRSRVVHWPDVEAFYADDERRRFSVEVDYGVHWRRGTRDPGSRVSWVQDTGELIIVWPNGTVRLLAVIPGRLRPGRDRYDDLEAPGRPLAGWTDLHPDLAALDRRLRAHDDVQLP